MLPITLTGLNVMRGALVTGCSYSTMAVGKSITEYKLAYGPSMFKNGGNIIPNNNNSPSYVKHFDLEGNYINRTTHYGQSVMISSSDMMMYSNGVAQLTDDLRLMNLLKLTVPLALGSE